MPANTLWFLVVGALLILMALTGTLLKRLPLSSSLLYLFVGVILGPDSLGLLHFDLLQGAHPLEALAEVAVLVSLFTAGLKLSFRFDERPWWLPLRLAFLAMTLTVGFLTLIGVFLLRLPVGAAILLGAILAPTDPVLAADVQVEHHQDRDRLRFGLTGEAGLNDGTAFPFALLGLGLLGLHPIGPFGWRWFAFDLLWSVLAGLGIGFGLGWLVARLVLHLRQQHSEALGFEEFLTLGLIGFSNGIALLLHANGFLAVFAAGLALRHIEQVKSNSRAVSSTPEVLTPLVAEEKKMEAATDPAKAPAYLTSSILSFNEKLERISEVALVVLVGAMLPIHALPLTAIWFVPLLFFVVRPLAVELSLIGARRISVLQHGLFCWFGIRGIGSVYYLAFAVNQGVPTPIVQQLAGLVFACITSSVLIHGISVTPLMERYQRRQNKKKAI